MSFILQLFHGPAVKTLPEAVAHTDRDAPASPDDQKRFAAFVAEVTRAYPNSDDEDSAWPEGLTPDGHEWATYNFAVNLDHLDENLMAHIGRAAANAGLKILDPQNGLLYPVEGKVIQMGGGSFPLPAPRPVKPPPPKGLPQGYDDEQAVNAKLSSQLAAVLAPYGFKFEPSGLVVRQVGRVKQGIDIGTMKRDREITLYVRLVFFCPEITVLWQELLGESVAAYVKHQATIPRHAGDIHLAAPELRRSPSESAKRYGRHSFVETHNWDEAYAWLRGLVAWLKDEGLADMDRMKDPAGLAEFVLSPTQDEMMFRRNDLLPRELYARLILMGAFAADRKEEWLRGYWDHYNRSAIRFDGGVIKDVKGQSERLIAWLETQEFARVAERLKSP